MERFDIASICLQYDLKAFKKYRNLWLRSMESILIEFLIFFICYYMNREFRIKFDTSPLRYFL